MPIPGHGDAPGGFGVRRKTLPCAVVGISNAGGKTHREVAKFAELYDPLLIDCPPAADSSVPQSALAAEIGAKRQKWRRAKGVGRTGERAPVAPLPCSTHPFCPSPLLAFSSCWPFATCGVWRATTFLFRLLRPRLWCGGACRFLLRAAHRWCKASSLHSRC